MPPLLSRIWRWIERRRWEAAKTSRLNSAHWSRAKDTTVNRDLVTDQKTLCARSVYEISNNPIVAGVVETHTVDVVGENGPTLNVQSDNEKFDKALERAWAAWWARPDVNGTMSGVDFLRLWHRSYWARGEYLAQIVPASADDLRRGDPFGFRLHAIHARRLATPPQHAGAWMHVLGVERNETGKPVAYWIDKQSDSVLYDLSYTYDRIPAAFILHDFLELEAGQARGVPWLAPALQEIADLRDFDVQTLDAARAAADSGVLLHTEHSDAPYIAAQESVEIERRQMATLPPGWRATQIRSEHPASNYVEYRHERLRSIGRLIGMPLMTVLLDASKHNYSSARMDTQVYQRWNTALQARYEGRALNRLLWLLALELEVQGAIPKRPAGEVTVTWTWDKAPHVDPQKEAGAEKERLLAGTITRTEVCASRGARYEQIVKQLAREKALREAEGLEEPIMDQAAKPPPAEAAPPSDGAEAAEGGDAPEKGAPARAERAPHKVEKCPDGKFKPKGGCPATTKKPEPPKKERPGAKPEASSAEAKAKAARSELAKKHHKESTREKQQLSDKIEADVAEAIGGAAIGATLSGDNQPVDIILNNGNGIEVKALHEGTQDRFQMRPDSRANKEAWKKENPKAKYVQVLVDNRDEFKGGEVAALYSGNKVYWTEETGATRFGTRGKDGSFSRSNAKKVHAAKDYADLRAQLKKAGFLP